MSEVKGLKGIQNRLDQMRDLLQMLADRKFRKIVTVVPGSWGRRCRGARGCRRKPKFMVFGDDGKPKMSRLASSCCAIHLPRVIERLDAKQTGSKK